MSKDVLCIATINQIIECSSESVEEALDGLHGARRICGD